MGREDSIHTARLHDSFYIRKSDCDGDVANLTVKEFNIRRVSPTDKRHIAAAQVDWSSVKTSTEHLIYTKIKINIYKCNQLV